MKRWFGLGLGLFGLAAVTMSATSTEAATKKPSIHIQLLDISDWHGQLDPLVINNVQIGGAPALSSYFKADRLANPNTLTVTAGDAFGATPPLSNYFSDEPAVKALNLMGLDIDTLGNHNFDRGIAHLQSLIDLAEYDFVSANLAHVEDNLTGVAPYKIFKLGKVKVAVIGLTNEEAPTLVFPGNFGSIEITDSVAAANEAREEAAEAGAHVFVIIAHKGVTGTDGSGNATGPLIDLANALTGFDVIIGDHTDVKYEGRHNGQLVIENLSHGESYAKVDIEVKHSGNKVLSTSVQFVTPVTAGAPGGLDQAIVDMLAPYRTELTAIFNVVVGESTVPIPRSDSCGQSAGRTCESLIGDVVTDAMRTTYGTDFSITNSGGLRADLTCPAAGNSVCSPSAQPPYPITTGEVFAVLPFGNLTVTSTLTGAVLKTALENGVSRMPAVDGRFPQVSGLCFSYDIAAAVGSRVTSAVRQAADGSCTGAAVDLTAGSTYAVALNDFMANGGDGYPVIIGSSVTQGPLDSVVNDYVAGQTPLSPLIQGRIACADSNGATAPNCPVTLP